MPDQRKDLPKVPPFVINGTSGVPAREPVSQPVPARPVAAQPGKPNHQHVSQRGMLSVLILLISAISLGIALAGGAWVGFTVLREGMSGQANMLPKIVVIGLAYLVGWLVALFGIRILGNLILPLFIKAYAWLTLMGISVLQIAIISKLFKQAYSTPKFGVYVLMFGVGLGALIGLHLILEKHTLAPFSFPILFISLAHLYLIVFHYIFVPEEKVKFDYLWGDVTFFLITSAISLLMLAHLGLLNGLRRWLERVFNQKNTQFVPPD
ncbi:MAG: hypothetical protein ACOYYJ_12290 [Chloroflexota bacterium]